MGAQLNPDYLGMVAFAVLSWLIAPHFARSHLARAERRGVAIELTQEETERRVRGMTRFLRLIGLAASAAGMITLLLEG